MEYVIIFLTALGVAFLVEWCYMGFCVTYGYIHTWKHRRAQTAINQFRDDFYKLKDIKSIEDVYCPVLKELLKNADGEEPVWGDEDEPIEVA